MPRRQRANWTLVLRLTVGLTCLARFVVLASGSALWLVECDRPNSTVRTGWRSLVLLRQSWPLRLRFTSLSTRSVL